MTNAVLTSVAGHVAWITLNRPQSRNALDAELTAQLRDAVFAAEADAGVRCVVIRGGEHFMAGGDLKAFNEKFLGGGADQTREAFQRLFRDAHPMIMSLRRMPKPVLASVAGSAAGFGLSLMMACDLAIAADNAVFTLAYSLIGASPDGGSTYALPRIVGARKAMEIALLGERFDAAAAERLGLVNRVVPALDLASETQRLAMRLAAGPTAAYGRTKALLNASFDNSLEAQLESEARLFAEGATGHDFAEGVRAFIEKRKPTFEGR
jgi:2-(1,2-epoxy-1,2-dihydrophenyl)acetyl-CoA isomerase